MRASVLSDNIGTEKFSGEWGLSIFIEYNGHSVLLDAGASPLFRENAAKLGIDPDGAEAAVLSHAHWDHADGLPCFLDGNTSAPLYVSSACADNCYSIKKGRLHYNGIPKGMLEKYAPRIVRNENKTELFDGVYALRHSAPELRLCGKREKMLRRSGILFRWDDFAHEQSLIFDMPKGLVIFNSCCHGGADTVIGEAADAFPGKKLYALIGGFHLHNKSDEFVLALVRRIRETGIEKIYTGHCTGLRAYDLMKKGLGDRVHQLRAGLVMEL